MKSACILYFFILLGVFSCSKCGKSIQVEIDTISCLSVEDVIFIPLDSMQYISILNFLSKGHKKTVSYEVVRDIKDGLGHRHSIKFIHGKTPSGRWINSISVRVYDKCTSELVSYFITPHGFTLSINSYTFSHHSELMIYGYITIMDKVSRKVKNK